MRQTTKVTLADNKEYELCFTILRLNQFEKSIGFSAIQAVGMASKITTLTIDLIVNGFAAGIGVTYEEAAEIIQTHCDNDGNLADVSNAVITAIVESGIFPKADGKESKKKATAKATR